MSRVGKALVAAAALVGVLGTGVYVWSSGYFAPEPAVTLPALPKIEIPQLQGMTESAPAVETKPQDSSAVPVQPVPKPEPQSQSPQQAQGHTPTEPKPQPEQQQSQPQNPPARPQPTTPTPNPQKTTEEIVQIVAQAFRPAFQSLQTQCEGELTRLADAAIAEYKAAGRTNKAKAAVSAKYLPQGRKLEATCERHFQTLVSSLESELRLHSLPLTLLEEIKRAYAQRVTEMKSILMKRAGF